MIDVNNMTLTYPSGKGVFDLNFKVEKGTVTGYLGPNGAGKTTTIRALLGFMAPNEGFCTISGMDCSRKAPEIQEFIGYVPGETAFPDQMDGREYLNFICDMRGAKDKSRMNQMLDRFELDPKGKIRRFSKGMKQKLAITAAFMQDPDVLILDEPSSGLDPLMQNRFIDLIMEEKKRGKTILLSSHIFEEVERTCDTILIIKEGRIVQNSDVDTLRKTQKKRFLLTPRKPAVAEEIIKQAGINYSKISDDNLELQIAGDGLDLMFKTLSQFEVADFSVKEQSLESIFMDFYSSDSSQNSQNSPNKTSKEGEAK